VPTRLLAAVKLAENADARLTVLLTTARPAKGPECCGINDGKWNELVGDALDDELSRAAEVVEAGAAQATFVRVEAEALPESVGDYARRKGCDLIVLPRAGLRRRGALGGRTEAALRGTGRCEVTRLPA
jgi:nucleotide-binding universal stress UspA family protein